MLVIGCKSHIYTDTIIVPSHFLLLHILASLVVVICMPLEGQKGKERVSVQFFLSYIGLVC